MAYKVISINDIYKSLGEDSTKEIIKDFECELNPDVEYFIKEKAIEFSKQDIAETFLVFAQYKDEMVISGYFAISNKGISIKKTFLSKTKRKRLLKYSTYDADSNCYHIALPLIGQLGKNFYNGYNKLISGDVLLKLACDKVKEAQDILGRTICILRV